MSTERLDVSEILLPRHHAVLRCLGLLSHTVPDGWSVVGGLMVLLAGHSVGASGERSSQTKDGDIVIDVVADPEALERVFRALQSLGYESPAGEFDDPRMARCTVSAGSSTVDILCPDDAAPELLDAGENRRSLAIPGGRRALELARPLRVTYHYESHDVDLRVPDIYGAIAVKSAAAVAPATREQTRHIQDVAFLLSAVPDPFTTAERLADDLDVVRSLEPLLRQTSSPAFQFLNEDERQRALATLDIVTG